MPSPGGLLELHQKGLDDPPRKIHLALCRCFLILSSDILVSKSITVQSDAAQDNDAVALLRPCRQACDSGEHVRLEWQQRLPACFALSALLRVLERAGLGAAVLDVFEHEKNPVQDHVLRLCR